MTVFLKPNLQNTFIQDNSGFLLTLLLILGISIVLYLILNRLLSTDRMLMSVSQDANQNQGIPFYRKIGIFTHKTTYLQPLMRMKVEIKVVKGEVGQEIKTRFEKLVSPTLENEIILKTIGKIMNDHQKVTNLSNFMSWHKRLNTEFDKLVSYEPQSCMNNCVLILETNKVTQEIVVDYSNPYFINQRQPAIGASELAVEIAADGTLSKASGKAEDKTIETLLSALPSDIFDLNVPTAEATVDESEEILGDPKMLSPQAGQIESIAKMDLQRVYMRHVLSRIVDGRSPLPPIEHDDEQVNYHRELVEKLVAASSKKTDDDKPNLTIGLKTITEDK